ncbi:MAG: hypothetical protein M3114_08365 [Thermoproteota archaeon]|nr:hypothetical protein [Thermoproteota archaeon]
MSKTSGPFRSILRSVQDNYSIFNFTLLLLIAIVITETTFARIQPFVRPGWVTEYGFTVFIIVGVIYCVGQFVILRTVKKRSKEILQKPKLYFSYMHRGVAIGQYGLIVIFGIIVLQILSLSHYDISLLIIAGYISYSLAILSMGILSYRFLKWFRAKKTFLMLLFGLSSSVIAFNALVGVIFINFTLQSLPSEISQHFPGTRPPIIASVLARDIIYTSFLVSSTASFMLTWAATAVLLSYYIKRFRKSAFWAVLGIPLIFFLLQFPPLIAGLFYPLLESDPVLFNTIYAGFLSLSNPIGGVIFAISFSVMARSITGTHRIKNFLIFSGFGYLMIFVTNQAIVLTLVLYPPLGLTVISLVGLSSYLILIGIYSSAITIAEDSKLRSEIRRIAASKSGLLGNIGLAQLMHQLENEVRVITRERSDMIDKEAGLEPLSDEVEL